MPRPDELHDFGGFDTLAKNGGDQGIGAYFDAVARRRVASKIKTARKEQDLSHEDLARKMLVATANLGYRPFEGPVTVAKVAQAIKDFEQCVWFPPIDWAQRLAGLLNYRLGFTLSPRTKAADRKFYDFLQSQQSL